jgi:hypothetical protein
MVWWMVCSSNPVYKMLATSLEQRSLDIKLACASLLNTLLRAAKDDAQFNLVKQCLTDTHGLLAQISGLVPHSFFISYLWLVLMCWYSCDMYDVI